MGRMGIEISSGKVGKVRGVALPGTDLRPPYTKRDLCESLMWDSRPRLSTRYLGAGEGAYATF